MPNHQPIITEDGSPSLLTTYSSGVTERMHHFRGALTESIYIYLPAVEWALEKTSNPSIMSLGLGLGYNELLAIGAGIKKSGTAKLALVTFENDQELRTQFSQWLNGDSTSPLSATYETVLSQVAAALGVDPNPLKNESARLLGDASWDLRGSFPENLTGTDRFNSILYDAFSAKMDEPLWSEDHLTGFLMAHAAPKAAFATYAAKGTLKRALKTCGFEFGYKEGFGGKKESTFATRE